jgi:hypothetical protein
MLFIGISENRKSRNIYLFKYGPSNTNSHLLAPSATHGGTGHSLIHPETISTIKLAPKPNISVYSQLVFGTNSIVFIPEVFREKLLRFIAVCYMLFSVVENPEFRDLMLYDSPYLRGNNTLLTTAKKVTCQPHANLLQDGEWAQFSN